MMLAIARVVFIAAALGIASLAAAAWIEPGTQVLQSNERGYCPLPPSARQVAAPVRPDHDLLLFIYSLSQRGFLG
ncbi:hypothetical protein [Stutzerimonas nitrititolerans]|uniref:hypothetical protein n=1 Tax=Stutzerimonas nitrititolerans TaxID=2482751 RepID=UPI0028A71B49|nr:hypothetical protein [Stutzerimonas nitrititolerans]